MALSGKVCVVTGASKGIGRGIALQLGASGGTVYLTGRSESNLLSAAEEIRRRGGEVSIGIYSKTMKKIFYYEFPCIL